jgi:hypothetical protein
VILLLWARVGLIAIVLAAGVALWGALMLVGTIGDKRLESVIRGRLQPGEEVVFQSVAMWRRTPLLRSLLTAQRIPGAGAYIVVTDRRIFFASSAIPVLWPIVNETWLRDVEDVQLTAPVWGQVRLTSNGRTQLITPMSGRLFNSPTDLVDRLVAAINRGRPVDA